MAALSPGVACAQSQYDFDLRAQPLGAALEAVGRVSHSNVIFDPASVRGRKAPALRGRYSASAAITALIRGLGLSVEVTEAGSFLVRESDTAATDDPPQSADILVTGTRVKGAAPASPLVEVTQQQMRDAGQHDLGEVVRSLPLNFGGGQNPGVMQGASTSSIANQNISGGSAINLRGLGPDATLTLLNGRRLAYDSFTQAVDLSTIPLAAISRIQIVPDGASAIYGSDAVAGVANIILRRDFTGLETSARVGTSTTGGGTQQQYDATAGTTWSTGGFMITGLYEQQDPISAKQRSYTRYMPGPADLISAEHHYSALFTGHQDITSAITLGLDATYANRKMFTRYSPGATTAYVGHWPSESYSIGPNLTARLPSNWSLSVSGMYGVDNAGYGSYATTLATKVTTFSSGCYCNSAAGAEASVEGPLFHWAGGATRVALGGGYRENTFTQVSDSTGRRQGGTRRSYYGYGEANLPIVSGTNAMPFLHALSLSGALRYEHYDDLGDVTTPKIGAIYSPVAGVEIKGTWGRSFKAPTLIQQYQAKYAYLYPATSTGATGYPATATVLIPYGGNINLKPERAETWSATLDLKPISGWHTAVSYFHIDYRDRVIQPINIFSALSNPVFEEFLTRNPTAEQQAAVFDGAFQFYNYANAAYDPTDVIAVAYDIYTNVARQRIEGVDLSSEYRFAWAGGTMNLSGQASWISSQQQNSANAAAFNLAGYLFNPPRFRARAGAAYASRPFSAAAYFNYTDGVIDNRLTPAVKGDSMATVDLSFSYRFSDGRRILRNTELAIDVQNLTNESPPYLRPTANNVVNYDSTNYSAIGRYVSATIRKRW